MSSNVGLSTPRGSGTSGYVQRNLSHLKPRDQARSAPYSLDAISKHKQRQPDAEILEHERKRKIEVQLFELRDRLEDEGVDEDEIDDQVDGLRKKLEAEDKKRAEKVDLKEARGLKGYQVHEIARAKIEESERVRRAFGIGKDYEEGGHWRRQEERKKEMEAKRAKEDEEEAKRQELREKDERAREEKTRERSESPSDLSSSEYTSDEER
jgi:cwf21 domain